MMLSKSDVFTIMVIASISASMQSFTSPIVLDPEGNVYFLCQRSSSSHLLKTQVQTLRTWMGFFYQQWNIQIDFP